MGNTHPKYLQHKEAIDLLGDQVDMRMHVKTLIQRNLLRRNGMRRVPLWNAKQTGDTLTSMLSSNSCSLTSSKW
jgi:hypothetical protein